MHASTTDHDSSEYEDEFDLSPISVNALEQRSPREVFAPVTFIQHDPRNNISVKGKVDTGAMVSCIPISMLSKIGMSKDNVKANNAVIRGVSGADLHNYGTVEAKVTCNNVTSQTTFFVTKCECAFILGLEFSTKFNLVSIAPVCMQQSILYHIEAVHITTVCCFHVNNSSSCRFYCHTQHVHSGRWHFRGGVKALKIASVKSRMQSTDSTLPTDLLRSVNQLRDKGASSWLTAVPLIDHGLVLNKQEFRDSLCLRYNMPLSDLPSMCVCDEKYTVCHALSCKKGGFVAQRHDGVRNLLTSLIDKACTNVKVEPQLQPLDNEQFNLRSAVTSPEARLEIKAGGFWSRGVTAFFDVRVTHVNSKCNQGKPTSTIFKEEEKKRKYQQRVLDVEMASFTPLVFGTNGGMGVECNCFVKRLAEKLSEKNDEPYHITVTWIRTLLSFEILRSVHTCVRGSRSPFRKIPQGYFVDDCRLNASQADVR